MSERERERERERESEREKERERDARTYIALYRNVGEQGDIKDTILFS